MIPGPFKEVLAFRTFVSLASSLQSIPVCKQILPHKHLRRLLYLLQFPVLVPLASRYLTANFTISIVVLNIYVFLELFKLTITVMMEYSTMLAFAIMMDGTFTIISNGKCLTTENVLNTFVLVVMYRH